MDFNEIIPGLYLTDLRTLDSWSVQDFRDANIINIVSIGCQPSTILDSLNYHIYPQFEDLPSVYMLSLWSKTDQIIKKSLEFNQGIVVHCVYGQSRSAATILSYLLGSMSFHSAFELIKNKRNCISINPGFLSQLFFSYEFPDISIKRLFEFQFRDYLVNKDNLPTPISLHEKHRHIYCKNCKFTLANEDEVINSSFNTVKQINEFVDEFWKPYLKTKPNQKIISLPIKEFFAVTHLPWINSDSDILTCPQCIKPVGERRRKSFAPIDLFLICDAFLLSTKETYIKRSLYPP